MNARQFRAARKRLGLSASQMAAALGMSGQRNGPGVRTVFRWSVAGLPRSATGKAMVEKIAALLIERDPLLKREEQGK